MCNVEGFINGNVKDGAEKMPLVLDVREQCLSDIIESDIECLRDPFVIYEDGVYYMYGTGWCCYRNSTGSLENGWEGPYSVVEMPAGHESEGGCHWASEVHKYKGSFLSLRKTTRLCGAVSNFIPYWVFSEVAGNNKK